MLGKYFVGKLGLERIQPLWVSTTMFPQIFRLGALFMYVWFVIYRDETVFLWKSFRAAGTSQVAAEKRNACRTVTRWSHHPSSRVETKSFYVVYGSCMIYASLCNTASWDLLYRVNFVHLIVRDLETDWFLHNSELSNIRWSRAFQVSTKSEPKVEHILSWDLGSLRAPPPPT